MTTGKIIVFATSFSDELMTKPSRTGEAARRLEQAAGDAGCTVEYRSDRDPSDPMTAAELESAAAAEHGVTVTNTPGVNALPMAEWALATLIDVASRRIPHHERAANGLRKTGPSRIDLSGKRVGIVGTGFSGRYMAELLSGFRPEILAYAPRPDRQWADAHGVRYVRLCELCSSCEFITLHASASHCVIGEEELALMGPTTVLVNCARSVLVDNRAVWKAVRDGRIWGYGIDEVWEHEDLPLDGHNIIASPHVASDTDGGKLGMQLGSVAAVIDFLQGRRPEHCVTP